jgi:NAD+ dependent glucose-6-phosphate dehydrogenase
MAKKRVLVTGAAGYVASRMLSVFRERYDLTLLDVSTEPSPGRNHAYLEPVKGVQIADLLDADRSKYAHYFEGVDVVVHLGYIRQQGEPIDHYDSQRQNVDMAHNVFRTAYDEGAERVVAASSNHAANWYEPNLLYPRKKESLDPYDLPLSHNFYGWSKATYEHLGFLFACGAFGRKMGMILVRIGSPGELDVGMFADNEVGLKRSLGSYLSQRDQTQLFVKAIEAEDIENEHGVPWHVVYGISNNTRAYWSLVNARRVLDYQPEDDAESRFAAHLEAAQLSAGRTGRPKT